MWVRIPPAAPASNDLRPVCQARPPDPISCIDDRGLGPGYAYLLGAYLGDGTLSPGHRNVWRLRIFTDSKYSGIIETCRGAVRDVTGRNAGLVPKIGYVEISSYWKHWLCVFPQHGAGRKHLRHIELEGWQASLVRRHPEEFIRGLIHSDGCRVINRVKSYAYPRYFFSNRSADLRELFVWACALIGVDARPSNRYNISVAKRRSVEILDRFIGPKR